MATYSIAQAGKGIKITSSDGWAKVFTAPVVSASPSGSSATLLYKDGTRSDVLEFVQGKSVLQIGYSELTTVGGVTKSGTLSGAQDQILALMPTGGGAMLGSNNLSDLTNVTTARANLLLGTMATQNASAVAITGGTIAGVAITSSTGAFTTLTTPVGATANSNARFGSMEIQPYAVNNLLITENAYFDGSVFKHRALGSASFFQINGGELAFHSAASQAAGTTSSILANYAQMKVSPAGDFGVGVTLAGAPGTWTGAALYLKGSSGNLMLNTITDDTVNKLQVNGSIKATQYRLSALNTAPTSATDTGTLGEVRLTAGYLFVCTATNTWVRSALTTW